MKEAEKGNVY